MGYNFNHKVYSVTAQEYEHWFQYFPKSFMWSQGFMSAIEMIPYGERRDSLAAGPLAGATTAPQD